MFKKLVMLVFAGFMFLNLCGFALIAAGVSEASKARETIDASYSKTIDMVKAAMISQGIELGKAVIKKDDARVKGSYPDGRSVNIFVHRVNDAKTSLEVRVGTSEAGKEDANKIIQAIILESFSQNGK